MPKSPMEKQPRRIRTTGELREFLADVLAMIDAGQIDDAKARNIAKIAAQINNSFYAEARVAIAEWQMKRETVPMGQMPLLPSPKKTIE